MSSNETPKEAKRTLIVGASSEYPTALASSLQGLSDVTGPSPIKAQAAAAAAPPPRPFRKFTDTRKAEGMSKRLKRIIRRGGL